jgi:hypothetical protein
MASNRCRRLVLVTGCLAFGLTLVSHTSTTLDGAVHRLMNSPPRTAVDDFHHAFDDALVRSSGGAESHTALAMLLDDVDTMRLRSGENLSHSTH